MEVHVTISTVVSYCQIQWGAEVAPAYYTVSGNVSDAVQHMTRLPRPAVLLFCWFCIPVSMPGAQLLFSLLTEMQHMNLGNIHLLPGF